MNAPAYPCTPIELMEDALTRVRIIARSLSLDATDARVELTPEGSHFSVTEKTIRLGLFDIARAIELGKSKHLVLYHEAYHLMAHLLLEKQSCDEKMTQQAGAISRSLASMRRGDPPPYAYFFGMLHNLIVGVIDQGMVEEHRNILKRPPAMIHRAEEDELVLMKHLAARLKGDENPMVAGETIEIISFIRSVLKDDPLEDRRYGSFKHKLLSLHDGCRIPSVVAALDVTLLFFLNRYQGNYEVRRLYIDLYRKIKGGHIFDNFGAATKKKIIELVHRPNNGNFNTYWNRYGVVPLRWVHASEDHPLCRKDSSPSILPRREYAWQGRFTRTSFFRFKLCRLPLLQQDTPSVAAVKTPPKTEQAADRDVLIVINPGNEMADDNDAKELFNDVANGTVKAAEALRLEALASGRHGAVEIFLVVLGVVNDVSVFPPEDGLVTLDINRILGGNDYPDFAGFLFAHRDSFSRYLRDGMIEQFHHYHPDLDRRILVMSRVFTDETMFDDKVNRIILMTHEMYCPGENPHPYGDLLFTDEAVASRIEYRHANEDTL